MYKAEYLTINTDASFCGKHKVGGFAFWIVHNDFVIKKAGKFKDLVKDSSEAEVNCIANAVFMVLQQKDLKPTRRLIINTDSRIGMRQIENQHTDSGKKAFDLINKLTAALKCEKWEFRHVKAHSGAADKRSYVNEWCDAEAKKYMRRARKEILKNQ